MWTYFVRSGDLADAEGELVATGYSGRADGLNNPAMEAERDVGPIPAGVYAIGDVRDSEAHGPIVMPLTPEAGTDMHGRSGFLIHGDNRCQDESASEGCIILDRVTRLKVAASPDKRLQVI